MMTLRSGVSGIVQGTIAGRLGFRRFVGQIPTPATRGGLHVRGSLTHPLELRARSPVRSGRRERTVYKLVLIVAALAILGLSGCGSTGSVPLGNQASQRVPDHVLLGNQNIQRVRAHIAAGRAQAFGFTARLSGGVTHARVYISVGNRARELLVGVYGTARPPRGQRGHTDLKPGTLITWGSIANPRTAQWNDVQLRRARLARGVNYWIALLGVRGQLRFRASRAGTPSYRSTQTRLAALPETYSPGARSRSGPASVYVAGFALGSSGPPSPPTQKCSGAPNTPGGSDPFGGCFPGPNNTGVPAGTSLTTLGSSGTGWTFSGGALEINRCGVAFNAVKIPGVVVVNPTASNGTHSASTPCVTITSSEIDGWVQVGSTDGTDPGGPLVLSDDTVNVPDDADDRSPVLSSNYYATRLNVEGGRLGFSCQGDCTIQDSYVHDGYLEQQFHYNAIGSNGGSNMDFEHNSLACDFKNDNEAAIQAGAGCSDDIGMFGDFDPLANITVNKNLFESSSRAYGGVPYCFNGSNPTPDKPYPYATNEVVTNNVFQRGGPPATRKHTCGLYGPVFAWTNGRSNVWSGNVWDDGKVLNEG